MRKFEPSKDFVSTVMASVHAYEEERARPEPALATGILFSRHFRYAMAGGGALVGITNLIRLYYPVFSPLVCR